MPRPTDPGTVLGEHPFGLEVVMGENHDLIVTASGRAPHRACSRFC